ncbi:MAG: DUF262 domain-containing protein [Polyangiales bacterium]
MPTLMTFKPQQNSLAELLEEIHRGDLQLPDFQRSWVWDDERIRDLLASVSQGWPVGAVLLLECGGEVQFKARPVEGAPAAPGREHRLILDGQQRLTTLYSTLRKGGVVDTRDERGNPIQRAYFFDIRRMLAPDVDRKDAILSLDPSLQIRKNFNREVELDLSTPEAQYRALCIPIASAFSNAASKAWGREMRRFYKQNASADELEELFDRFDVEVVETIQNYHVPSIELGKGTSRQAVCMVFEKVNTGGKPLDVFELVTATYAARSVDLREDWERRRKRLAEHRTLCEVSATDFLQAITLLSTCRRGAVDRRVHVGCRRVDMLNLPLDEYRAHADAIERGYVAVARLLERERVFDPEYLPYQTQLIPFAAIVAVLGERLDDGAAREKLLRWYWCGVFGELYSGSTETRFGRDITEVPLWVDGGAEPTTVRDCNFVPARLATLSTRNSAAYKGFMALLLQKGARDVFTGDEVDASTWRDEHVDLRFVFPEEFFKKATGLPPGIHKSILNKTPRTAKTWRRLGLTNPGVYLARVEAKGVSAEKLDDRLRSHCVEPASLRREDAAGFFRERARRLLDEVERLTGRPIQGRDAEETVRLYGGPVPAVTDDVRVPTEKLFEQYTVLTVLPSGGMSEGYKVRGPDGGVAFLKKVPVEGVAGDALRREIDVYTRLHRSDAEGVLRVLGIERNDTHVALLTEFADGGALSAHVRARGGALPPAEAKAVAEAVLAALRELHAIDVVHRDLKPENVLRVGDRWKLADFGIAKNLARPVTQHRTFAGHGTPGFAPPEQVDGAEARPSADVFAFGKLLVYLLTGQTDVDKLTLPSWARLARECTALDPDQRPRLDDVDAALAALRV